MIGETLSHYKVVEKLGSGGMGDVYVAQDLKLGRRVALKVLPPQMADSPDRRARFEKEARAVAALSHPNVLAIHDFDEDGGVCFAVMELLDGETLGERLKASRLPVSKAIEYSRQIADGLSAAHDRGIVHRDLKPANLFVTSEGPIKILDFGLAQWSEAVTEGEDDSPTLERPTEPGAIVGTVGYMSPEQVRGRATDHRSDIFSFGVVLYEMLTGRRPFAGESSADTMSAILKEDPAALEDSGAEIPPNLARIVKRCLEKNPGERFQSARDLGFALQALSDVQAPSIPSTDPSLASPAFSLKRTSWLRLAVPTVLAVVVLSFFLYRQLERSSQVRWARQEGIPEVMRLVEDGNYAGAFDIASRVEILLPNDPVLAELSPEFTRTLSITSEPPGAEVFMKPYAELDAPWKAYGPTPIDELRLPREPHRFEIRKDGFRTIEAAFTGLSRTRKNVRSFTLDRENELPPDLVRIPGGEFTLAIPGLEQLEPVQIPDFLIDKYEVTNRQYKVFLDAGGYEKPEYWKQVFVKEGRELSWKQATAAFTDTAGRPGPSTWELGDYPEGQDDHPVTGISWFEAAAYAEWADRSLPTIYHWDRAASRRMSYVMVPLSAMGTRAPTEVGRHSGISAYGIYDMAGNAREWCWNEDGRQGRFILGGGWDDHAYFFNDAYAQNPFDRSPTNGFRTIKQLDEPDNLARLLEPLERPFRDFFNETPVSDEIFAVYKSQYAYDRTPLNAEIEATDESSGDWTKIKIAFDAAYGNERMTAYLFLPRASKPPYQTIVFFPGSNALTTRSSESLRIRSLDFMIKSGRAVIYPVFKSTYERGDGLVSDYAEATSLWKEHVIQWAKDLGRSIDYLETREDIDTTKLAYYGLSWGGEMGGIMLAVEDRFEIGVLFIAGLGLQKPLPEVDAINFVTRIDLPVLMLNGRYDFFFPYETSQKPMFELLGTPSEHKRQMVYETGHSVPRKELVKESLDWLDRYLGPVR